VAVGTLMARRRRQTAHDVKRRLMRMFSAMDHHQVTRVVTELREFALAKKFFGGESFEQLTRDESVGPLVWTRDRLEQAVRNQRRAAR
jgi:hypothetical protein